MRAISRWFERWRKPRSSTNLLVLRNTPTVYLMDGNRVSLSKEKIPLWYISSVELLPFSLRIRLHLSSCVLWPCVLERVKMRLKVWLSEWITQPQMDLCMSLFSLQSSLKNPPFSKNCHSTRAERCPPVSKVKTNPAAEIPSPLPVLTPCLCLTHGSNEMRTCKLAVKEMERPLTS